MERERDMGRETDCVYVVVTHADRKIKKVGERRLIEKSGLL